MKGKSMEKEIIYQYPVQEMALEFSCKFYKQIKRNKKNKRIIIWLCLISLFFFLMYSIPVLSAIDYISLILAVFSVIICFMYIKGISKNTVQHQLAITAYEDKMEITYYSDCKACQKEIYIKYDDILSCKFFDDSYTKIQITFQDSMESYVECYDENHNEIEYSLPNFAIVELNPFSYEQGFFMYIAPELFTIKGFAMTKKILKKYGNKKEYFERIGDN